MTDKELTETLKKRGLPYNAKIFTCAEICAAFDLNANVFITLCYYHSIRITDQRKQGIKRYSGFPPLIERRQLSRLIENLEEK